MNTHQEARSIAQEGFQLLQQNELANGAILIERALEMSPRDPYILNALGVAHLRAGNNFKALCFLYRAEDVLVKSPSVSESLAVIKNNIETAAGRLEEEGLAHLRASRPARAEHFFKQALEFAPDRLRLRRGHISALEMRANLPAAFSCAKALLSDLIGAQTPNRQNLEKMKKALEIFLPLNKDT